MTSPRLSVTHIGAIEIGELVGRGGMGVVYRGHDQRLDRPVAVKVLFAIDDHENRVRFEREAQALARLSHPNIVQVFDSGEVEGWPYFVMEWIDGPSLAEVIELRGALQPVEALAYALQAADGLQAAAEAGIIHRDVKPGNLLLTDEGVIKIVDFGLARIAEGPSELSVAGVAMGTPHFMAPEQARGEAIDARSDQYALGATLYHLLCGRPPFEADNDVAVLLKHQQLDPPPLTERLVDCPPALWNVVRTMLAKDPVHRFADYDLLSEALLLASEGRVRSRRVVFVAGALLVATGLILTSLLGLRWLATSTTLPATTTVDASSSPSGAPVEDAGSGHSVEDAADLSERVLTRGFLRNLDDDDVVRQVHSLGKQAEDWDLLLSLLDEPRVILRVTAASRLGALDDRRATPPLIELLDDSNPRVVRTAIVALGSLHDLRALAPLDRIARRHPLAPVRALAKRIRTGLFAVEPSPQTIVDSGPRDL